METMRLTDEQCSVIKARIAAAETHQEAQWMLPAGTSAPLDEAWIDRPGRTLHLVKGRYWDYIESDVRPQRFVNQLLPKMMAKEAVITMGGTSVIVEPLQEQFQGEEEQIAAFLQQEVDKHGWDRVFERARRDHDIYGFAAVEVGWRFKRAEEEVEGGRGEPTVPDDAQPIVNENGELMAPVEINEYPTQEIAEAAARQDVIEQDADMWAGVLEDDAFVERVCPRDILVDPRATSWDLSDARYAFRRKFVPLLRVKANKGYKNTKDLTGRAMSTDITHAALDLSKDVIRDDQAYVCLYDGYMWWQDVKTERFIRVVMTDEHDKPLLVQPCPYLDDDGEKPLFAQSPFPWRILQGLVVDNETFYCEAGAEQAADLQVCYDQVFYALNEQRRRGVSVWIAPEGELSTTVIDQIESGQDGLVIQVPRALFDGDLIKPLPRTFDESELLGMLEFISVEIGRQLGVSQYEESVLPDKQLTATEASNLQQMGGSRTRMEIENYNTWRSLILQDLLTLYQVFGNRPRSYSQKTADGKTQWGVMTNEDLRGTALDGETLLPAGSQWSVKVCASSEPEKNRLEEREQKLGLLQVLAPFSQPDPMTGQKLVDIKPILRMICEAFQVPDINAVLPEPVQAPPAVPGAMPGMPGLPGVPGNGGNGGNPGAPVAGVGPTGNVA